ncbi:MAG: hypothetical protein U0694_27175 [Anaerolineae bacterium]
MVGAQINQQIQPLKVLPGLNSKLELYPDRVVISRTDFFGKLLPEWVGAGHEIPLNDLKGVFLTESRGADSPWILIVLTTHEGHRTLMAYQRHDYKMAQEIKNLIDDYINKK